MEFTKNNSANFHVCELVVDSDKAKITADTIELRIFEIIEGGTYKIYDWNDSTFKSTATTTQEDSCTHKTVDNGTYNTGIFENNMAIDKDAFTSGVTYVFEFYNNSESELVSQTRTVWGTYGPMALEDTSGVIQAQTDKMNFTGNDIDATLDGEKVTVEAIDTDVVDAASLKADAVVEIQAGLGTTANQTAIINAIAALNNLASSAELDAAQTSIEALINALNNLTAAEVVTSLKASTGWTEGGTATFTTLMKALYAMAKGKFSKSGDDYTFYDDDDTTELFTLSIATSGRTSS